MLQARDPHPLHRERVNARGAELHHVDAANCAKTEYDGVTGAHERWLRKHRVEAIASTRFPERTAPPMD